MNKVYASDAPGWPGSPGRWTSSAKSGVGTALSASSRIWFTLSHGILNEVYYPRIDLACIRDCGLIVTDGAGFFSEEKRHASHEVQYLAEGVPAYRLINRCTQSRYQIEKTVLADPQRDVILQQLRFTALTGSLADYQLFVLLAPHLYNQGAGNNAWLHDYKGVPMLFAARDGVALALACTAPWMARSVGFVGQSDGWQDLTQHGSLTWHYQRAENGNVALIGEIDLQACAGICTLALGFGYTPGEAALRARTSLMSGFEQAQAMYVQQWQGWQHVLASLATSNSAAHPRTSAMVLRVHESKELPGGMTASLSVPWGSTKGDGDLGGYHLVWPRDLVETAGGLLAIGAHADARKVIDYLYATQEADGHWPQNMWLDGATYWNGIQLDETAFPILLLDLAARTGAMNAQDRLRFWPMVRAAAGFLVRNGPITGQDRWEENAGYSPFTLAVMIAALLAAADLAEQHDQPDLASYLRETADSWNDDIERWCYVRGTNLAQQLGVEGYYVRMMPPEVLSAPVSEDVAIQIKNRPADQSSYPAAAIVSPDALALVRFGLRSADDPRILNTLTVIDALLKVETPNGPAWHRYNEDGYGEHADGRPFDGTGIGRVWPLFTGERAHYALAAGQLQAAQQLLQNLEAQASAAGLLSEQVWDSADVAEQELFFGRPSGSAMPLVWAHAEHLKLCRSLTDGKVFDVPPQPVARYQQSLSTSACLIWSFQQQRRSIPLGRSLRIELQAQARIHWSSDGWQIAHDLATTPSGLGSFYADLPTKTLPAQTVIVFTCYWNEAQRWEGRDMMVTILPTD